ncbi:2-C-methyl-D-erythritol 4-phosphate cytidylyltransferase [Agromyces archimandritae]|uniref:2-C-methyl-D-erythritol 4-phosphate cytidylyltransferase n=1 Tax=Agromyces archimandritae TaxID=2781962 RepID=UPI001FD48F4F|nr:2-C-methyl-D-erythritol 4-phosphate cytidylyltransferase [Agromyces archimandritae]
MSTVHLAVIVVAAGSGTRLGADAPKAFVDLSGRTMLERACASVAALAEPVELVVVAPEERLGEARAVAARAGTEGAVVVAGAATRQGSVAAGLAAVAPGIETVLVHDAARALAPTALFARVAAAVREHGDGVVPVLPVVDTIKRVDAGGAVLGTVDRSELAAVQTPQGFPRQLIEHAFAVAGAEHTDDAALVQSAGGTVRAVAGEEIAFKITTPADLERAERLLGGPAASAPRIGTGVDVHAFADDDSVPLWIAGLEWPGQTGLAGHSDGDVVVHAMCDALLAAAGRGDLGAIFGTADPAFAGAHGEVFLRETLRVVGEAGFRVGSVSVQLIGNRPKLGTRRAEAEALLSGVLGAPVSVAATTSDGLGFTGRGEGLAAIATAIVHAA